MGPITLFDKSFLQALSTDESVWFDNYFYPVIAPLFFIETLADLWKTPRAGKSAEDEVGIIAAKTPQMSGGPCYFHHDLCIQDLLGNHVPLNGQIPSANMRRVVRDNKEGAIAEITPEAKAFQRWQDGQFYDVERLYAREWRRQVESIDLTVIERAMKQLGISSKTCKTLDSAINLADQFLNGLTKTPSRFDSALEVLDVPTSMRRHVKERWKHKHKPSLRTFAPYAAHVLRVELFFSIAVGANLVASTRASHKVDIAYLYYLPFCTLFASSDKLHRQCAPLFMRTDQEFVWGGDLKADLGRLNTHFSSLPEEVKKLGIYKFANQLPAESQGLIRKLFERHTPNMLKIPEAVDPEKNAKNSHKKLLDEARLWASAPAMAAGDQASDGELEIMVIKRAISRNRGSWVQIGPEIEGDET
ncbi:hypothetical protein NJF54_17755 [Pseudomonas guariconensis]|uniref:hypothetical protein n=1 Tax=Pseudomonas guariconensis TaxID=1288410 RepID=UPI00209BADFD|nr:hypothetical protein [Pseudomonas guariconensis]MCO7633677.1 hypothetical protein [Pseudomonas guariconensis]